MSEPIRSIQTHLTPPRDLVEATKRSAAAIGRADSKSTHIRRFSKVFAVYAIAVALFIGGAFAIPALLNDRTASPVNSSSSSSVSTKPSDISTKPSDTTKPSDVDPEPPPDLPSPVELLNNITPDQIDATVHTYYENSRSISDADEIETIFTALKALARSASETPASNSEVESDRRCYTIKLSDSSKSLGYTFEFTESLHLRCSDGSGFSDWFRVDVTMAENLFPALGVDVDHSDQLFQSLYGGVVLLYEINPYEIHIAASEEEDGRTILKRDNRDAFQAILTALEALMKGEGQAADQDYVNGLDATKITLSLRGDPQPLYPGGPYDTVILEYTYELVDGKYLRYSGFPQSGNVSDWYEVDGRLASALIDLIESPETPITIQEPLTGETVEKWMDARVLLNDKIDIDSLFSKWVNVAEFSALSNLFDDVFTAEEWAKAEADGRFEEATHYFGYDGNNDGLIDSRVELGEVFFEISSNSAIHWSMTEAVTLDSYVVYTSINGAIYKGRSPDSWRLYATNDDALVASAQNGSLSVSFDDTEAMADAGWVLLDDVPDAGLTDVNAEPFGYTIDPADQGAYKHYCWVFAPTRHMGYYALNGMKLFASR